MCRGLYDLLALFHAIARGEFLWNKYSFKTRNLCRVQRPAFSFFLSKPRNCCKSRHSETTVGGATGATSAILFAMNALGQIFPQKGIDKTVKCYVNLCSKLVP